MPDRHNVIGTEEDVQLTEFDLLLLIEVASRTEHGEEQRTVPLQLWTLMGGDRIIDGQWVEAELGGDRQDVVSGRPVQADPGHALSLPQQFVRFLQTRRIIGTTAIHIDRVVDHTGSPEPFQVTVRIQDADTPYVRGRR